MMLRMVLLLAISIAIEAVSLFLESNYIVPFLVSKIVEMQITLMAINTATSSFIVSKLQEVAQQYRTSFSSVYRSIKMSLFYQIALIIFSILCLTVRSSHVLSPLFRSYPNTKYIFAVLIIYSFICAIDILRDTGAAMFNILMELDGKSEKKQK